jgi:metal-responsive CopG/Arc/MetJ family transcriptional regulator
MPTVNVYLGDEEYKGLLELVRRSGKQRGQLVREAVRALLEREGVLRA